MENLLIEIGIACLKLFLNPLIYWIMIISFIISRRRVRDEHAQFGQKMFPLGFEYHHSWKISLMGFFFLSVISILFHMTFLTEFILFFSLITFFLSFILGFKLLSAVYSLGFTFILFKFLQLSHNQLFELGMVTNHTFSSIALLIGLILLLEASLYKTVTNETAFPEIVKSKRGRWFGLYHVQRASFIPFLVLIPGQVSIGALPVLPYFTLGNEDISFAIMPLWIGFHHIIKGDLPERVISQLGKNNILLSILVLIAALVSFYLPGIASFAILLAIIGKVYINYNTEHYDQTKDILFLELKNDLKIFAIVPESPADKLGLRVGDTITKINDRPVTSLEDLNDQLSSLIRLPTFEVVTANHEVKVISNNSYRGNSDELGIIFLKDNPS